MIMLAQYIDKAIVETEIKRRISAYQKDYDITNNKMVKSLINGRILGLNSFLSFINTLEVKTIIK